MRFISFLLILFCLPTCNPPLQGWHQFPIVVNDLIGYINSTGKPIIEPKYFYGSDFKEGLAAVRIDGTYGYIDSTGQVIIPSQFDYATPFSEGFAIVYKDSLPFFIDKKGKFLSQHHYRALGDFENGFAPVKTFSKRTGMINRKGRLVLDTIFQDIGSFHYGYAVVSSEHDDIGVVDSLGKFLIPYGVYTSIGDFSGEYFQVTWKVEKPHWDGDYDLEETGFVNKDAKLFLQVPENSNLTIRKSLNDGLVAVKVPAIRSYTPEGAVYSSDEDHEGYMNIKGELVIDNPEIIEAFTFVHQRAFVKTRKDEYRIIDTSGHFVSPQSFDYIEDESFFQGNAIVRQNDRYGIVDTGGHFLIPPKYERIIRTKNNDPYFFYAVLHKDKDSPEEYNFGIVSITGETLLPPILDGFSWEGYQFGILSCSIKNKLTYINSAGKIIWQEKKSNKRNGEFNIDHMNRGYFYAYAVAAYDHYGGYARSANLSIPLKDADHFPCDSLCLLVDTSKNEPYYQDWRGYQVYIANTMLDSVDFSAQDSRLYMNVQALHPSGVWMDIEYLPSSWCGNSYHRITLQSGYYWKFVTPVYHGNIPTKLRIKLTGFTKNGSRGYGSEDGFTIYSNEYSGSVNPGQFWRKKGYYPHDLMDPYFD